MTPGCHIRSLAGRWEVSVREHMHDGAVVETRVRVSPNMVPQKTYPNYEPIAL